MLKMKVYNVIKSKSTGKASSKARMFVAVNLAIGLVKLKNIKGIWSFSLIQAQVLLCPHHILLISHHVEVLINKVNSTSSKTKPTPGES
jgi:hypothetical protein